MVKISIDIPTQTNSPNLDSSTTNTIPPLLFIDIFIIAYRASKEK